MWLFVLFGWTAEKAVEEAREEVAKLVNADPREIVWTSGATESNNLAIKGASHFYSTKGKHVLTIATEHKAVIDAVRELETSNGRIKPSVKNVKIIAKIKSQLRKIIFDKEFESELDDLVKTYDDIGKLQTAYYASIVGKFTLPKVLKEVRSLSIQSTLDAFGEDALAANVLEPLQSILVKNVTPTGGSSEEYWSMGASLNQQCRVWDDGVLRCKPLSDGTKSDINRRDGTVKGRVG